MHMGSASLYWSEGLERVSFVQWKARFFVHYLIKDNQCWPNISGSLLLCVQQNLVAQEKMPSSTKHRSEITLPGKVLAFPFLSPATFGASLYFQFSHLQSLNVIMFLLEQISQPLWMRTRSSTEPRLDLHHR